MVVWVEYEEIYFLFFIFFFSNIKAATILDYEAEILIEDILKIICTANDCQKSLKYSLILDNNPNAFVNQENIIYISTGLIKYTESYEALIGVISHEIGHIENFHVRKRKDSIKKIKKFGNFTNLSIMAGSLLSNNSDYLAQSLITNQFGIQNYYQSFTRDQEREADYYAVETLNKLNISSKPLVKFLNLLEKQSIEKGITNDYYKFSSHPIYKERYNIINSKSTNFKKLNFDKNLNKRFYSLKAKIFGFTENKKNSYKEILDGDYKSYADAIILSKEGNLLDSMKILNKLISKKFNYNFLIETKADILYSNGFLSEALLFYEKAIDFNKNNKYVTKRVFDIKFLKNKENNKILSKNLFDEFAFLLSIFYRDKELEDKFKRLATELNLIEWINYFSNKQKFYNNGIIQKDYQLIMNNIKTNTKDINLHKLIKNELSYVNEKI